MGGGLHFGVASKNATWHPDPDGRGTYGLVSSCLITMALCVWTAVHLNLPEHNRTKMQTWRKVWWLVLGLFAPELVAWNAFEQYREASALYQKIKDVLGEESPQPFLQRIGIRRKAKPAVDLELNPKTPANPKRHPWTMTHSFYATMGGFAFDSDTMKQDFLPDGRKRVTLTSLGVLHLATVTPHLLPNVSISQIKDRSKANNLAKTIVCLQAFWFVAQFISRLAGGLAVSLLELNTFAHAICALMAYSFWWSKPFDVEEPSIIEGEHVAVVCAGMCTKSYIGDGLIIHTTKRHIRVYDGQIVLGFEFAVFDYSSPSARSRKQVRVREASSFNTVDEDSGGSHRRLFLRLTLEDQLRLRLAKNCYELYPAMEAAKDYKNTDVLAFVVSRVGNWPDSSKNCKSFRFGNVWERNKPIYVTFSVAGLVYGGIHLLAWNPPVSTASQIIMWRISGVTLAISGTVSFLQTGLFQGFGKISPSRKTSEGELLREIVGWAVEIPLCVSVAGTVILYIFARIYLFVECFISIPHLPSSVFESTNWSQYFPHLR
ncbi:hypothetical protein BKA64DRAFT_571551 [Cadophora sp. MPI-SDFR-AT-0126]|nr:hypothetical protein BKA64DRAFT_571551 [Leotiomycetes sp. MPI-SDFR-AT-0126]